MSRRVESLSYSAIMTFLRNQVEFQKRYIAKIYDKPLNPSMVVGSAFHKALEVYYSDGGIDAAIAAGVEYIAQTSDYEIDYGKTGSREKMNNDYKNLVNKYFEEAPVYDVFAVEKNFSGEINNVPMKGVVDLIVCDAGLHIRDYKTVTSYSDENETNYKYLLQGFIYLVLAEKDLGEQIKTVTFDEVKKTINLDGSPQRREFIFNRDDLLEFAPVAQKIITNVFTYVNDDNAKFFPNPSDVLDGQSSMDIVSNIEDGFNATKIRHQVKKADRFAPRNTIVDLDDGSGSNEDKILRKFTEFGKFGMMDKTYIGASVIRYTFKPNRGVALRDLPKYSGDIAMALSAKSVRIEAPIYGTNLVGIEIPNEDRRTIRLAAKHFKPGTLEIPVGEDIFGKIRYADIAKMPHLLIAGQTGSGKSVMINVILESITQQLKPSELKLVLIDPKQVELAGFENSKHLLRPVVTDAVEASTTLNDMVGIMNRRYSKLRKAGVRSIEDYTGNMPKIVIVVDEFADLMMSDVKPSVETMDIAKFKDNLQYAIANGSGNITQKAIKDALKSTIEQTAPPSCEDSIIRLAQKARAVGMHLVLATQRPSADVVTGLIKANIPTKIAFAVTSAVNSKIILDQTGAESLTGYGDMLFQDPRSNHLERLQGLYA